MISRLSFAVFLCGILLFSLSSCSDPTSVGADIGPDSLDDGTPQSFEIVPSTLDTISTPSETGINAPPTSAPGPTSRSWRFLTGLVDDPISGTIEAQGYVDFLGAAARGSEIEEASVDSLDAELRLETTYLHGDSTSALEVQLFDLLEEADMHRAPADTSFISEEQAFTSSTVSPSDSLVAIDLPQSWIERHVDALQDTSAFEDDFNGLKLTTTSGNAVVGFEHSSATLRLTTSSDTVDFRALKSFSGIERRGSPDVPLDNWALLQDGVGTALEMAWDFDRPPLDSLRNTPLNDADISVPVDTTKMEASRPANFVRPTASSYRILATEPEGVSSVCSQIGVPRDQFCVLPTRPAVAPGIARMLPDAAFAIFDRAFFDTPPFDSFRFEIAIQENESPSPENSIRRGLPSTTPVLVRTSNPDSEPDDKANLPRATLIVTPL